jgi:hypothetical protein
VASEEESALVVEKEQIRLPPRRSKLWSAVRIGMTGVDFPYGWGEDPCNNRNDSVGDVF